ncbi:MAG TPA: hypothetical protein VGO80_03755 [Solirubrobacteraceae bacterium]|nr:hypothetical protein [Solirubrobacteraceae bacterium]
MVVTRRRPPSRPCPRGTCRRPARRDPVAVGLEPTAGEALSSPLLPGFAPPVGEIFAA